MVCTRCGMIGADVQPDWVASREQVLPNLRVNGRMIVYMSWTEKGERRSLGPYQGVDNEALIEDLKQLMRRHTGEISIITGPDPCDPYFRDNLGRFA
jgi:hypothetical protein